MKIYHCNIFDLASRADAICITTNGNIKADGSAVMGRGIALQAKRLFPGIQHYLSDHLRRLGNRPGFIWNNPCIVSFPTKDNWYDKSSLDLIEQSAFYLSEMIRINRWTKVAITKPGCANGRLNWQDVEPIIEKHLPNVYVCDYKY
jgi:hypothetical protein